MKDSAGKGHSCFLSGDRLGELWEKTSVMGLRASGGQDVRRDSAGAICICADAPVGLAQVPCDHRLNQRRQHLGTAILTEPGIGDEPFRREVPGEFERLIEVGAKVGRRSLLGAYKSATDVTGEPGRYGSEAACDHTACRRTRLQRNEHEPDEQGEPQHHDYRTSA